MAGLLVPAHIAATEGRDGVGVVMTLKPHRAGRAQPRDVSAGAEAIRGNPGGMRRDYAAVLAAAACCYAALGAVLRILPDLVEANAVLGLAVGAPALTALLTRPAGGRLADSAGPRPVLLAGAVVMAAGALPTLAADAPAPLVGSRLAVGAGEGAMMSAA